MADAEPKNAASDFIRAGVRALNRLEAPTSEVRWPLTDDFVSEDRRRGPTTFPPFDAELGAKAIASFWDTGAGRPRFIVPEILAVRGESLVVCRVEVDFGNGWTTESIQLLELDATLTLIQRTFDFDVDDVDAALAELDRLHNQADTR